MLKRESVEIRYLFDIPPVVCLYNKRDFIFFSTPPHPFILPAGTQSSPRYAVVVRT